MADIRVSTRAALAGPGTALIDVSARTKNASGGSGRQPGRLTPRAGTANITIDDDDDFFRPGSNTSDYQPSTAVGGQAVTEAAYQGATYRLFSGYIDPVEAIPARDTSTVQIRCSDEFSRLTQLEVTLGARPAERTGARFAAVMEAAGYGDTLPDGGVNPRRDLWRAAGGFATCAPLTHEVTETALEMLTRTARTEAGRLVIRNGRPPNGVVSMDAYRPHLRDPNPVMKITDQPTAASDVTMASEPQIVSADDSLLVTAVESLLPAGETVETTWPARIAQHGRHVLRNPVWLDAPDAERLALRWLGLFGRPLLRARRLVVRADAQQQEPGGVHAVLGARVGERVDLVFQQTAGGGGALDEQFEIWGIDWRVWPLDARGSAVELTFDLLPITEVERWILGVSELGPHTAGRTMNRAVPWPGEPSAGDQVRPRVWDAEGPARNVYGVDFDRLLRKRAIARYPDFETLRRLEFSPLPGQLAVTTDDVRHKLYAFDPAIGDRGDWEQVAVA